MRILANDNFRSTRIKKGFTTVSLAEVVGISKQSIGQIERRVSGISPDKAQKVIKALDVEFDEVFELVEREATLK